MSEGCLQHLLFWKFANFFEELHLIFLKLLNLGSLLARSDGALLHGDGIQAIDVGFDLLLWSHDQARWSTDLGKLLIEGDNVLLVDFMSVSCDVAALSTSRLVIESL